MTDKQDFIAGNVDYHKTLSPLAWEDNKLRKEVQLKLLEIARAFVGYLDIPNFKIEDIVLTGSMANYNYTSFSDFDVHVVTKYSDLQCNNIAEAFYRAKKEIWNNEHDITIRGHDAELYVEDTETPPVSGGMYSILRDKWITEPEYDPPKINNTAVNAKARDLITQIEHAIDGDAQDIERLRTKIRNMRRAGLDAGGEFSVENLAFKILRNEGYLDKLHKAQTKKVDKQLSLESALKVFSSDQVLAYIDKVHTEFNLDHAVENYPKWVLKMLPVANLKGPGDGDPYNRDFTLDHDHVSSITQDDIKNRAIVADSDGWIIDGNHRHAAAKQYGMSHMPAFVPHQEVTETVVNEATPGEFVYHASYLPNPQRGLQSVMTRGLVPSKDGYGGPGVYFAYDPEGGFYHVDQEDATMFRAKWADLVAKFGKYPDNPNGIQRDDDEIIVPGIVPANMLEVEYFPGEWWDIPSAYYASKGPVSESLLEGGWASTETQNTVITPKTVAEILHVLQVFQRSYNTWQANNGLDTEIKIGSPKGSGTYYRRDLEQDPAREYGDVDVECFIHSREGVTSAQRITEYKKSISEYCSQSPDFSTDNGTNIIMRTTDGPVQVDLIYTYHEHANWSRALSPEYRVKGVISTSLTSSLAEVLNLSFSSQGVQVKIRDNQPVSFRQSKDTELRTVSIDPETWAQDIYGLYYYLAKGEKPTQLPRGLLAHGGLKDEQRLSDIVLSIKALATGLEDAGLLGHGSLIGIHDKQDLIRKVATVYSNKLETAENSSKFNKAETPAAIEKAMKTKLMLAKYRNEVTKLLLN